MTIEHVVFDLDDTLLDTSASLLPQATREAVLAMIDAGLCANPEEALRAVHEREGRFPRQNLFSFLVDRFGVHTDVEPAQVASRGSDAFYNRQVERDIALTRGASRLLTELREAGYHLHLVTQGHRPTQEQKISILGIAANFETISHVDPLRGECKREAFAKIQERTGAPPSHHLSVGNRIDTDIAEAKAIGWHTCWVRYGEYRFLIPIQPAETPDVTVPSLEEMREKCRL